MIVSADQLRAEELRLKYVSLLDDPSVYPTRENWQYIIDNKMEGVGPALLNRYITALEVDDVDRAELHSIAIEEFPRYLEAVDRDYALSIIYEGGAGHDISVDLIRRSRLFDANYLLNLIDCGELDLALDVIDVYQPEYIDSDLDAMEMLAKCIDALPDKGTIEDRRGIFGTSSKYICPNGHVNDAGTTYCTHSGCGLDIKGLTKRRADAVEIFRHRLEALRNLI